MHTTVHKLSCAGTKKLHNDHAMKIFTTLLFLGLSIASFRSQIVTLDWAKQIGGPLATSNANSITVDGSGNLYTTGLFSTGLTAVDFDPSNAILDIVGMTSNGASNDIFVSKLNSSGNYAWAIKMGGSGNDAGNAITTDAAGNVYVAGYFQGTVDFDPATLSATNLVSAGGTDIFVAKYTSAGAFTWAKRLGGTGADNATALLIDAAGNVLITGTFSGTGDFDPGAGTANLVSAGGTDVFISKLTTAGAYVWAKQMGSTLDDGANAIESAANEYYTTGYFQGSVDFDPGAGTNILTSAGDKDAFISKLDASGLHVWTRQLGGTAEDIGAGIQLDQTGNVITSGSFQGTADFDPGVAVNAFTSVAGKDIFVNKLDASGVFTWNRQMGGTGDDIVYAMEVDLTNNIYTTGAFDGTADFNPGGISNVLSSLGGTDIFISKIDKFGNYVFGSQYAGLGSERGTGVVVDGSNNIFTTGTFELTVDFDPGLLTLGVLSLGGGDIFITRMGQTVTTLPIGLLNFEVASSGNVVALSWTTSSEQDNDYFSLERSVNGTDWQQLGTVDGAGTTNQQRSYTFTDKDPLPGILYYRLRQVDLNGDEIFSAIESVEVTFQSEDKVRVYPNPSNGKFQVFIAGSEVKQGTMRVRDFSGHTLFEQADLKGNVFNVDLSNHSAGVFLLEMEIDGNLSTMRVVTY